MNYRIVKISDNYAIRRGFMFHEYLDLKGGKEFWWSRGSKYFNCCLSKDLASINEIYEILNAKEMIIR